MIRTRNDLFDWLGANAPSRTIARAIEEGEVENYGGFQINSWIVRVQSRFGTDWFVRIRAHQSGYTANIIYDGKIPWENWIGWTSSNGLYTGDYPSKYLELRNKEIEKQELEEF